MTNDVAMCGPEWFRIDPVPKSVIDEITPLLDSGDRETYLRGWLAVMVKALLFCRSSASATSRGGVRPLPQKRMHTPNDR